MQTGLNFDVVDVAFYGIGWKRFLFLLFIAGERGQNISIHIITEHFFFNYSLPFYYWLQSQFAFLVAIILTRPADTNI